MTQMMGQHIMERLRQQLFDHLMRMPIQYYDRTATRRILTRMTSDVDALNDLFASGIVGSSPTSRCSSALSACSYG